jgi:hypothetical protein
MESADGRDDSLNDRGSGFTATMKSDQLGETLKFENLNKIELR